VTRTRPGTACPHQVSRRTCQPSRAIARYEEPSPQELATDRIPDPVAVFVVAGGVQGPVAADEEQVPQVLRGRIRFEAAAEGAIAWSRDDEVDLGFGGRAPHDLIVRSRYVVVRSTARDSEALERGDEFVRAGELTAVGLAGERGGRRRGRPHRPLRRLISVKAHGRTCRSAQNGQQSGKDRECMRAEGTEGEIARGPATAEHSRRANKR